MKRYILLLCCFLFAACNKSGLQEISVSSISLDKESVKLVQGEGEILKYSILPSNATNKNVLWSSSNNVVATVSTDGLVKAKSPGNVTITVTTEDGAHKAYCNITVQAIEIRVTGISIDKESLSLTEGETSALYATIIPSNATNKSTTWQSSDNSVATVSKYGQVSAIKAGNAVITAITEDGGYRAECGIQVNERKTIENPLKFTAVTDAEIALSKKKGGYSSYTVSLEYSLDNKVWTTYTIGNKITLSRGSYVLFRAKNASGNKSFNTDREEFHFEIPSGSIAASGNIMSLLNKYESLEAIPNDYCFTYLFYDCKRLITSPELPAKTLSKGCYESMFSGCGLTQAPKLPAMKLSDNCYEAMFLNCPELLGPPELPATQLANRCYYDMFYWCSSLSTAPGLPATQLAEKCYSFMFDGCSSLSTAPELPAMQLADGCYAGMFANCISLSTAPKLPAMQLAEECYDSMFACCHSLSTAPELPAMQLADRCYYSMFESCEKLTSPPNRLPATQLAKSCYEGMFSRCISLSTAPELPSTQLADRCYCSMFKSCEKLTSPPNRLPATQLAKSCYEDMFNSCTSLASAPELPAIQLADRCYYSMFESCKKITTAPVLPAMEMKESCYENMFCLCNSLLAVPSLPAMQLAEACYKNMFYGCNFTSALSSLPATQLEPSCYEGMFCLCLNLKNAPDLPAVDLVYHCYYGMFWSCINLSSITAMFTTTPGDAYTSGWLYGVKSSGIFTKNKSATWDVRGTNGIPEGWTVKTK